MKKEKMTQLRHLTSKINVLGYLVSRSKSKTEVKKRLNQMSRMLEKAEDLTESLRRV